jgi:CBS domain-containing protein
MIDLTCAEIMRVNLRTLIETDEVAVATEEMVHDRLTHLLVVDSLGRISGIVSDRDLLRARSPSTPLVDVMRRDVQTVGPGALAAYAVERMLHRGCSAVAVVDMDRRPIGIVTGQDFLDIAYGALLELEPRRARRDVGMRIDHGSRP